MKVSFLLISFPKPLLLKEGGVVRFLSNTYQNQCFFFWSLLCLGGDSSHEEVVKLLSGEVLDVFWRSNGTGGRRRDPLLEGK